MINVDKYVGLTKAIVIDNEDPSGYHRIKVRILSIHGAVNLQTYGNITSLAAQYCHVNDEDLPWIEVCYPFGHCTPPEINQVVWVCFYRGDVTVPVVLGWAGYEYNKEELPLTSQARSI